jgi:hypothetical protein
MTEMSNTSQQKCSTTKIKSWDEAILKADAEIDKMERYLTRLKAAKNTFQLSKREGMEWPGSVQGFVDKLAGKAGTDRESIPA